MKQNELIELLKKAKNEERPELKLKIVLEFINQVLTIGENSFENNEIEERFSEFAYDIDNYEPNPQNREGVYYGEEILNKKIEQFINELNFLLNLKE